LVSVGFTRNGVESKAERRKPSVEKHCDIENLPSLAGVIAHFRLHAFHAIRLDAGGAKTRVRRNSTRGINGFLILPSQIAPSVQYLFELYFEFMNFL